MKEQIESTDATIITRAPTSYVSNKELEFIKLVGQGYDGASLFAGVHGGE